MELRSTHYLPAVMKPTCLLIIALLALALAAERSHQLAPDPKLDTQSDADYQADELEQIVPKKIDYIEDSSKPVWFERFARLLQAAGRPKAAELSALWRRNVDNSQVTPALPEPLADLQRARPDLEFDPDTNTLRSKSTVPEIDSIGGLDLDDLRRLVPAEPAAGGEQ